MMLRAPVRFDPQRRAAQANLKQCIKAFIHHLDAEESRLGIRKRTRRENDRRSFALAVEAIACNLLLTAMVAPTAVLSVPRGHTAMWGNGRYRSPVYGQHFIGVLDLLECLQLTETVNRGYRLSPRKTQPTTIRPTQALLQHLPLGQTDWTAFTREVEPEVIVLKSKKAADDDAQPVDYNDTAQTKHWRREVERINKRLAAASITILGDQPRAIRLDKTGQPIEPYRRTLRRVFNNENWNAGGRLFDGFWMTMERTERFRTIRIAGEEIANVDYSTLFPRLAYVRTQAEQPDDDLYDVTGDGTCRDGWKALTNALLFATRPLRAWPTDTSRLFPDGTKLKEAIAAIKRKHEPIAHLFEQGLGFQLMRYESDLLIAVVTALFKNGITALPLHDSVLVACSHAETAKDFMEQEFKHRTGALCAFVKIDKGLL